MNKKRGAICLVAGRSGGHIQPALTIARKYRATNPQTFIIFFSSNTQLDHSLIKNNQAIDLHIALPLGNIPHNPLRIFSYAIHFFYCMIKSFFILRRHSAQRLVSTGGYISIPVACAAVLSRVPIILFELNAAPGRASKLLAPLCHSINICFAHAKNYFPQYKTQKTPYPIRFDRTTNTKKAVHQTPTFSLKKKTLFILGGSQGSISINQTVKKFVEQNSKANKKLQIIHQTGATDTFCWEKFYKKKGIAAQIFAFEHSLEKMASYYRQADLILCRAGAGTIFETLFFKKRSVLIPLETKITSHQANNACAIARQYPELFVVVSQDAAHNNPQELFGYIRSML